VFSGFLAEAYLAPHDLRNPLLTLELSKIAEKPLSHDYKHYMFQSSKKKETRKPQIQPQPAKETPQKQKISLHKAYSDFLKDLERLKSPENKKRGEFAGEISKRFECEIIP
jgi:hypothetical protein